MMITPDYARMMAAYNAEMNRRFYAAAAKLSDEERRRHQGAFWGSIHGTLNHILWGDTIWMARFAGWDAPALGIKQSHAMEEDFTRLSSLRAEADRRIQDWAGGMSEDWLKGDYSWMSAAANREIRKPRALLVAHFFNHQTHHRGQVHAMLTAMGQDTGDTDLPFVL